MPGHRTALARRVSEKEERLTCQNLVRLRRCQKSWVSGVSSVDALPRVEVSESSTIVAVFPTGGNGPRARWGQISMRRPKDRVKRMRESADLRTRMDGKSRLLPHVLELVQTTEGNSDEVEPSTQRAVAWGSANVRKARSASDLPPSLLVMPQLAS
jgi:hypothetical protein